jgi:uncharacterized protein YndB with AHSA1/START domain
MGKLVGQTRGVGFQFGLRKTFAVSQASTWQFIFSEEGLKIWLGSIDTDLSLKGRFKTKDGIEGLIRVLVPGSHIRLNWKKVDWPNMSTLQIRVMGDEKKTTVSFHQEKLKDSHQRDEMSAHWTAVMEAIVLAMAGR